MTQSTPQAPRHAPSEQTGPVVHPLMYHLVVQATRIPTLLRGQHVHVHGRDLIPESGRLIIAGNHVSTLDPFLIAQSLPRGRYVQFMAKKELFRGVIGRIILGGGSFPVDRTTNDLGAIRNALRILQAEGTLGIFPEGTRGGKELQGGAALLALKSKAPITPTGLHLSGKTWVVRFGPPILPSGGVKDLTARIGSEIERLSQPF
ncbi:1-acyl-sn-glycerol-3-phosphate acyltransferase [Deinococcus sonorensis]|uniref:1-acyl-sn-glycerol-3-phosphate acyltransferase n=2 Tax=Deinococcus sonorensis TaxID=309891 RepID=A0AAU7UD24_9DEIO